MELARHKAFTIATDMQVYFCDPRSPWQWGSNENTNELLRQYFPNGASLASYSQSDLNKNLQFTGQGSDAWSMLDPLHGPPP
jgi:IS30 family transposase